MQNLGGGEVCQIRVQYPEGMMFQLKDLTPSNLICFKFEMIPHFLIIRLHVVGS